MMWQSITAYALIPYMRALKFACQDSGGSATAQVWLALTSQQEGSPFIGPRKHAEPVQVGGTGGVREGGERGEGWLAGDGEMPPG